MLEKMSEMYQQSPIFNMLLQKGYQFCIVCWCYKCQLMGVKYTYYGVVAADGQIDCKTNAQCTFPYNKQ
jgi:hypothetical protein